MIIATHNGIFHADDVFALATLKLLHPDATIVRTRDPEELNKADLRVDVGGKYNPSNGDFDHHQAEGAGKRENDIPYAACGLIWKEFGVKLCGSEKVAQRIETKLIQAIDANDVGMDIYEATVAKPYAVNKIVEAYNTSWNEERNQDAAFLEAVAFAKKVLEREIAHGQGREIAYDLVRKAAQIAGDTKYIVLKKYCPWQEVVIDETDALYVVFPGITGEDWRIRCVPTEKGSFDVRKPLPAQWGGKNDEELAKICGVSDAVFCHNKLFIAGAKSFEGAKQMVELALQE